MYPTLIEDTNGNQVLIAYQAGAGLPASAVNTSARMVSVEDLRGKGAPTYNFTWNTDSPVPHLTGITNVPGTGETYTMNYPTGLTLGPPFGTDPAYTGLTTSHLANLTLSTGATYQFTYDAAGAAELTQVKFPDGGHLRWTYTAGNYNGNRALREVGARYAATDVNGAMEWGPYTFSHNDTYNSNLTVHANTTVTDASGVGAKTWSFITEAGSSGQLWPRRIPI